MRKVWLVAILLTGCLLLLSCDDDGGTTADGDTAALLDVGDGSADTRANDAQDTGGTDTTDGSDTTGGSDTGGTDTHTEPDLDPGCAAANGNGFFPDCSLCLDPSNCDSIDAPGASGRACGCSGSSDCPCGLSCGSYEIAPGITVGGICVAR